MKMPPPTIYAYIKWLASSETSRWKFYMHNAHTATETYWKKFEQIKWMFNKRIQSILLGIDASTMKSLYSFDKIVPAAIVMYIYIDEGTIACYSF